MEEQRKEISNNINEKLFSRQLKIAKILILMGLSMLISLFVTVYIQKHLQYIIDVISKFDKSFIIIAIISCYLMLQGITNYKSIVKYRNNPIAKRAIPYGEMLSSILPYALVTAYVIVYFFLGPGLIDFYNNKSKIVFHYFMNALLIYAILFELIKGFENIVGIFNSSVKDSKDRLSIIITILATIISAIALFK